jgi:hypothetical protein
MDYPTLAILLLTYGGSPERRTYAERTLRTTLDNLRYSGNLRVHIADDGSGDEHWRALYDLAGGYPHVHGITMTDGNRGGYGHNYNLATQVIHREAEIVLPLEDDWELVRELNLDPLVEALQDPRIGCIRMGYLGFTREAVRGQLVHVAGGTYFLIDANNEEPHVFAGHPRLELAAWERAVGPWPEAYLDGTPGIPTPGDTEFMVCHKPKAREGIAWPTHLARTDGGDLFAHIGSVRSY